MSQVDRCEFSPDNMNISTRGSVHGIVGLDINMGDIAMEMLPDLVATPVVKQ